VRDPAVTETEYATHRVSLRAASAGQTPSGVSNRAAPLATFLFTRPVTVAEVALMAPSVVASRTMAVPANIGQVAVAGVPATITFPLPVSEIVPAEACGSDSRDTPRTVLELIR